MILQRKTDPLIEKRVSFLVSALGAKKGETLSPENLSRRLWKPNPQQAQLYETSRDGYRLARIPRVDNISLERVS